MTYLSTYNRFSESPRSCQNYHITEAGIWIQGKGNATRSKVRPDHHLDCDGTLYLLNFEEIVKMIDDNNYRYDGEIAP